MSWVRLTDTAALHPIVLAVMEHPDADERSADELFGYMTRLATQSAQHFTDYVIAYSTALQLAGSKGRADSLLALAEFSGYGVNEVDTETGRRRFRLVDDPEFIHLKTAEEWAWEQQRKADNSNPDICAPVRCRDGDACRYCGNVVNWFARKGQLRGTYDHRPPGQPGSAETSVVACGSCNAKRGNQPVEAADATLPLLSPPLAPYFHSGTREWLQGHHIVLAQHGMTPPEVAPEQKNLTAGRPVAAPAAPKSGVRRAATKTTHHPAPTRPLVEAAAEPAPTSVRPAAPRSWPTSPADLPAGPSRSQQIAGLQDLDSPGRDGTGRDGSGQHGSGQHDSPGGASPRSAATTPPPSSPRPSDPSQAKPRRRRGSRGGRSNKPQTQGDSVASTT